MKLNYVRAIKIAFLLTPAFLTHNQTEAANLVSETNLDRDTVTIIHYTQPFDIESDLIVSTLPLREFSAEVDSIMRTDTIKKVEIEGIASIDGPVALNERLAKARAIAMSDWLQKTTTIPAGIISLKARGEDWAMFRSLVEADKKIPGQETLLNIIKSNKGVNEKEKEIRKMLGGETWKYLALHTFPLMRCAEVTLDVKHRFIVPVPLEKLPVITETDTITEEVVEIIEIMEEEAPVEDEYKCPRRFYVKTDLPYWLMSWSNLAFEVDFAPHWSFNLPIYFSAVNYFKHDIKFRTFSFQPGVRYWLRECNTGVYLEAHYGMGWWNFAFGGDYRYQDHFRKSPTMGGGIAAGYRLPISKNGRWAMEFGAGVGVYRLDYDRFQNRYNGKLIDSRKKTVFFIDNVNVSISYSIPLERKGR